MNKNTFNSTGESRGESNKGSWESQDEGAMGGMSEEYGDEPMPGRGESSGADDRIARLRDVGRNLGEQIEVQLRERPYVVMGAVAGLGFAAGSLLGSRLGQIAIALAGGYLLRNAIKSDGQGVQRFVKEGIDKLTQERAAD
jgi:hypothetical protein